jgi:hypothetical protein
MNTPLQLSDLFHKRGHDWSWNDRIADQNKLMERLRQYPDLVEYADEVKDFAEAGVASLVFLEYILERVTKVCSAKNIAIC